MIARTEELWHKNNQLEEAQANLKQVNAELADQAQELTQALQKLQQTQAQLVQTEKMSSLGQMIAGIAHEINNPVNFIHGNFDHVEGYTQDLLSLVQLYQQQYPHPTDMIQAQANAIDFAFVADDLPKMLASMRMGTDRIRELVLSLRNFSRLDEAEVKAVDLHEGIDSTLLILNNRLKQKITVVKQYGDLPLVNCYPAQLNQVFMNLLGNAIDALLSQTEQPNKQIVIQTRAIDLKQVQVRIKDNGSGIPVALHRRIFDPFFTTKPIGQGTGLGLSICYQIIQKHHGQIEINPATREGAEFIITLPT